MFEKSIFGRYGKKIDDLAKENTRLKDELERVARERDEFRGKLERIEEILKNEGWGTK